MTQLPPRSGEYPPQPYGAYPPPQGGYGVPFTGYPAPKPTNSLAIVSLVCAFVFAPLGILFGHISLSQIRKSGEEGRGLAMAGLIISYVVTALSIVAIAVMVLFLIAVGRGLHDWDANWNNPRGPYTAQPAADPDPLPPFKPPATLGSNCQYPATTEPASRPNQPPRTGRIPTDPAIINAGIATSQGDVGLQLDNAKAPCTVNNFVSLARQHYFDNTPCHRLTTSAVLGVLQCGDPSGTGTGGPGYRFPNEYPTNQFRITDPALNAKVLYPRGTLAMANSGTGTNGSQFFLVYRDSTLPPTYTAFGRIDASGVAVLDKIAAAGVENGNDDGKPAMAVTITSVRVG